MQYREFGNTGRQVSAIGFGGAAVSGEGKGYSFGAITEAESVSLLHMAFDAGITLFDTAPIYGYGVSERRIGKAFKDRRDDVFIVSKSGIDWDETKRMRIDNSVEVTERMLEQSLRDLDTDYIDLFLIHWPDVNIDIRKPVEALAKAKEAGKIRAFGLSNSNPEDIAKASEVGELSALQAEFSLFAQEPTGTLFPEARKRNLGFMSYGTLDKGILTGRVTPERKFDKYDLRSRVPWWTKTDRTPKYAAMAELKPLLEDAGHTGLELAVAFVLHHPEVSTALCGGRTPEQVQGLVDALGHLPSADLLEQAVAIAKKHLG